MKSKKHLKKKAIYLRKKGLSYKEIKEKIVVAKSTLSLWLKDIVLTKKQRERLYTKQINILSLGSQSQKERRKREIEKIIELSRKEVKFPLSNQSFLLFGAALYWAEGSKSSHSLEMTNSDPHIILFMVKWFKVLFNTGPEQLKAHLNIYIQQNESDIKRFWSDLTGIPVSNFGKSYIKPLNKGYKKNNLYFGTIKIRVPKSADLVHRVFGWTQKVMKGIDPHVEKKQKRWARLKTVARPVNLDRK